jgi:Zinc-binding dehydrogenase
MIAAQGRVSPLLAVEVAIFSRPTADRHRAARVDPADQHRKSAFGGRRAATANCSSSGLRSSTPGSGPGIVAAMRPQRHITFIDTFDESILPFKAKSLTISWEMMFTRSLFQTDDMDAQHCLLSEISALIDTSVLRSTLTQNLGRISVESLRNALLAVESGRVIGKVVLEGF